MTSQIPAMKPASRLIHAYSSIWKSSATPKPAHACCNALQGPKYVSAFLDQLRMKLDGKLRFSAILRTTLQILSVGCIKTLGNWNFS